MAREWMDTANGTFETPFGPMRYAATHANHVHIGGEQGHARIEVRGVEYHFSIHIYLVDGRWTTRGSGMDAFHAHQGLYMRKTTSTNYDRSFASDFARNKALAAVLGAWEAFVGGRPEILREGKLQRLNNEIMQLENREEKLLEDLKAMRETLEALKAEERRLSGQDKVKVEIGLVVGGKAGGGCEYEFSVMIERVGGRAALTLRLFNDSWKAFTDCPEVFNILARLHDDGRRGATKKDFDFLCGELERAGWRRHRPTRKEPEIRKCESCGQTVGEGRGA